MFRIINNKNLKKYLLYATVVIFIAAISTVGVTYAWFTGSSINLENIFTAGTVEIEVEDRTDLNGTGSGTDIVSPGDRLEKTFEITNTGSKSIYVRARFEGYWERIYHKNTATATTTFTGMEVTDSDIAHFYYENQEPAPEPVAGTSVGFTDSDYHSSIIAVFADNLSSEVQVDSNNANNLLLSQSLSTVSNWAEYPADCSGPKVDPITESEVNADSELDYFDGGPGPDPNPDKLPYPDNCVERHYFKIDLDEDDIVDGKTYSIADTDTTSSDGQTNFEVTIYKSADNKTFAFTTNQPVYHVYAKGGNQGGNLYRYYFPEGDPEYDEGMTEDCGLSQPENPSGQAEGWSHITFYFCEPPDDPDDPKLQLIKEVSVDGGNSWSSAGDYPGSPLIYPNIPKFRFIVENTGNVTLYDIEVEDDVLDLDPDNENSRIWIIDELAPGQTDELEIDYVEWAGIMQMENIKVELCDDMDKWVPEGPQDLGTYFYHTEILRAEGAGNYEATLCVNIKFEDDGSYHDGTEFKLYSYFEAVQASNDIILENWPIEDLEWYFDQRTVINIKTKKYFKGVITLYNLTNKVQRRQKYKVDYQQVN